jgi:hypothetical protein
MTVDKTLLDNNRRELNLSGGSSVEGVLPEYFAAEYPKLVALLSNYYDYSDEDSSPNKLIQQLFQSRDLVQTDADLLGFIEDELLLGQNHFQGFINKRAAAQYSSTLYRSKGTLYSIQQFFRSFFGITPDAVYTKENVFLLNESEIGPDSLRYLTNNELYQTYAILIKSAIPISEWRDAYKLFVHPAGMFVGAEIQIISTVDTETNLMPDVIPAAEILPSQVGVATITSEQYTDLTGLVDYDGSSNLRIFLPALTIGDVEGIPISELDAAYDDLGEAMGTNSATFDEDDDGADVSTPRFDQDLDTFDEVNYTS